VTPTPNPKPHTTTTPLRRSTRLAQQPSMRPTGSVGSQTTSVRSSKQSIKMMPPPPRTRQRDASSPSPGATESASLSQSPQQATDKHTASVLEVSPTRGPRSQGQQRPRSSTRHNSEAAYRRSNRARTGHTHSKSTPYPQRSGLLPTSGDVAAPPTSLIVILKISPEKLRRYPQTPKAPIPIQ
jgi:hypothetical protein